MPITITAATSHDIRFPTSRTLAGSDAMNKNPDYSAAYVVLSTDHPGLEGHGLTFTIGRGNELCVAAIDALAPLVVGRTLESFTADMGAFWRHITGDSQLRWLGPEKGVIHLATAALVNAVWDCYARAEGKPLWRLLCDMSPEELVRCVDFRYIDDVITPDQARALLEQQLPGRAARLERLAATGYPAYTTSAGWLGYDDDTLRRLLRQATADGFRHIKQKVGSDPAADLRRAQIIREELGPDGHLMMDANQVWGVDEAIGRMAALAAFRPLWIEEPILPEIENGLQRCAERGTVVISTNAIVDNRPLCKLAVCSLVNDGLMNDGLIHRVSSPLQK